MMTVFPVAPLTKGTGGGRHQLGFTLLELLIVCLLISISLTVALPSIKLFVQVDDLGTDARKIISLLREVRAKAMGEQQAYLIHLDPGEKKIWYEMETAKEVKKQGQELSPQQDGAVVQLAESVRLETVLTRPLNKAETAPYTLWVSQQGYTKQSVIQLSNDQGDFLSLELSPFLGEIKVHETLWALD